MSRTENDGSADQPRPVKREAGREDDIRIHLLRAAILASSCALMLPGVWGHSATVVEFVQLPAGLAAWQGGSLGIYRVCGPVSKLVYGMPAHLAGVRVDYPEKFNSDVHSRREWELGRIFQDQNVDYYHNFYRWSRLLPILVMVLGGCLVCEWSTRLFGTWSGIASLCAWCWSPPILAHGSLVTSDVPAAVAALIAARVFWAFLLKPNILHAVIVGLTLGLGASTKFSLLVLYPCWAFLAAFRIPQICNSYWRMASIGIVVLTTSIVAIDACYLFQNVGSLLIELADGSSSFARGIVYLQRIPALAWMLNVPLPLPMEFLRGIDVQIADGERLQSAYLLGETCLGGWLWWYPAAFLIKTPLPFLILLAVSLIFMPQAIRNDASASWAALCLIVPAVEAAVAVAASTGTGTNAAFRYLIPSLALMCVWVGAASFAIGPRFISCLLAWLILDAIAAVPDHLGWRNEVAQAWEFWSGAPALIGDSLDWSQDIARLGTWVARHSGEGSVQICVYGLGSGHPYGLTPSTTSTESSVYIAVSNDILFGYESGITINIGGQRSTTSEGRRLVLKSLPPYAQVGRTIRIYRITDVYSAESAP